MVETVHNPTASDRRIEMGSPRLHCILVVDNGGGVTADQLAAINGGLGFLEGEFRARPGMAPEVEISVFASGLSEDDDFLPCESFGPVLATQYRAPTLRAHEHGDLGCALEVALAVSVAEVEERKIALQAFRRPLVLLLAVGPTIDEDLSDLVTEVRRLEGYKELLFFPVGLEGADLSGFAECGVRQPLVVKTGDVDWMFHWVGQVLERMVWASPSAMVPLLDPLRPYGWGTLSTAGPSQSLVNARGPVGWAYTD